MEKLKTKPSLENVLSDVSDISDIKKGNTPPKSCYTYSSMEKCYTKQYNIRLPIQQIDFLKQLPQGKASDFVREALNEKIQTTLPKPKNQTLQIVQEINKLEKTKQTILQNPDYLNALKQLKPIRSFAESTGICSLNDMAVFIEDIQNDTFKVEMAIEQGSSKTYPLNHYWIITKNGIKHDIGCLPTGYFYPDPKNVNKQEVKEILLEYEKQFKEAAYLLKVVEAFEQEASQIDAEIENLKEKCIAVSHSAIQLYSKPPLPPKEPSQTSQTSEPNLDNPNELAKALMKKRG